MTVSLAGKTQEDLQEEQEIIWDDQSLSQALSRKVEHTFRAYGVSINSRTVKEGDIFIAIEGKNFDGNDFAKDALDKGAAVVIVSKLSPDLEKGDKRVILVDDTLEALRQMAKYARARLKGKVIGVTGSVGKTGSKEMLKLTFSHQGNVFASEGSFNNHIGLPLTLARMPRDTDFAIIEMGMNHAGELKELSALAAPDIAIITTVEEVHLEFFKSVSAIADAKSEIFDGMKEGDFAIINFDNVYHKILLTKAYAKKLQIIGFSEQYNTPAKLISYRFEDGISYVTADLFGREYHYKLNACGKHLAFNSVAVLAAVKIAGAELECASFNLAGFNNVKGRGEVHDLGKIIVIDESYNASPVAVKAALENLNAYKEANKRLVAILGTMVELGPNFDKFHKNLDTDIINNKVDQVFCVGEMKYLYDQLPKEKQGICTESSEEMAEQIKKYIKIGDVVLVKGSRSVKMEKVVETLLSLEK